MNTPPQLFDSSRIQKNRKRARTRFAHHDFLHKRIWKDMIERTSLIKRKFTDPLVVGELIPDISGSAADNWQQTNFLQPDIRELDLLLSFLQLHVTNDVPGELLRMRKSLRPDGVFLGTLFGGYTLDALRSSLFAAECELNQGAASRIAPFIDVRTLGSLAQTAGFALPVIDVDTITVRYKSLWELLHDLRYMGEANPMIGPLRPLSRPVISRAQDIYQEKFADSDGLLPARFDILHICGWSPHESQQKPLAPGAGEMFLGDAFSKIR